MLEHPHGGVFHAFPDQCLHSSTLVDDIVLLGDGTVFKRGERTANSIRWLICIPLFAPAALTAFFFLSYKPLDTLISIYNKTSLYDLHHVLRNRQDSHRRPRH
jgi:hypothetical protein